MSRPPNVTRWLLPATIAAPVPLSETRTSLIVSGLLPNTLEILSRISLPPTLVRTMSRTVSSLNPVWDRPVVAGAACAAAQVPTQASGVLAEAVAGAQGTIVDSSAAAAIRVITNAFSRTSPHARIVNYINVVPMRHSGVSRMCRSRCGNPTPPTGGGYAIRKFHDLSHMLPQ